MNAAGRAAPTAGGSTAAEHALALLGLARRAGRLALGATAVQKMVSSGARPVIIMACDASAPQRRRWSRLQPVRGIVGDLLTRGELAARLGRADLAVVAVADKSFVRGLFELGVVADPAAAGAVRS